MYWSADTLICSLPAPISVKSLKMLAVVTGRNQWRHVSEKIKLFLSQTVEARS